jgi:opacity protein-like surface antigen
MWKTSLTCGLLALGGTALVARAADMPLFPQPVLQEAEPAPQFEFGTGWYLRGDLAASDDREPNVLGTLGQTSEDWNFAVGGGAGYKFTDNFRADVTGDWLGTQKHSDSTRFACDIGGTTYNSCTAKSNLRRWDTLVNGYFDLGNWNGFVPYIGAGVGVAGIRTDGSGTGYVGDVPTAFFKVKGHTDYNFAWSAMAGFAYHLTPNILLDVGYRYLDLGTYRSPDPFFALNGGSKTDLTSHEVRIGVRYMLY